MTFEYYVQYVVLYSPQYHDCVGACTVSLRCCANQLNNKDHVAKLREAYMNDVIDVIDVIASYPKAPFGEKAYRLKKKKKKIDVMLAS